MTVTEFASVQGATMVQDPSALDLFIPVTGDASVDKITETVQPISEDRSALRDVYSHMYAGWEWLHHCAAMWRDLEYFAGHIEHVQLQPNRAFIERTDELYRSYLARLYWDAGYAYVADGMPYRLPFAQEPPTPTRVIHEWTGPKHRKPKRRQWRDRLRNAAEALGDFIEAFRWG